MTCGCNQTTMLKGSELQQEAEEYHPTWYLQEWTQGHMTWPLKCTAPLIVMNTIQSHFTGNRFATPMQPHFSSAETGPWPWATSDHVLKRNFTVLNLTHSKLIPPSLTITCLISSLNGSNVGATKISALPSLLFQSFEFLDAIFNYRQVRGTALVADVTNVTIALFAKRNRHSNFWVSARGSSTLSSIMCHVHIHI